jgi:hypothetical protein
MCFSRHGSSLHRSTRVFACPPTIYITNPEIVLETAQFELQPVDEFDLSNNQLANILVKFDPNQFDPNQFDPNQFDPNQFDPNQFDPNQFDPDQLDMYNNTLVKPRSTEQDIDVMENGCYCGCIIRSFLYHCIIS